MVHETGICTRKWVAGSVQNRCAPAKGTSNHTSSANSFASMPRAALPTARSCIQKKIFRGPQRTAGASQNRRASGSPGLPSLSHLATPFDPATALWLSLLVPARLDTSCLVLLAACRVAQAVERACVNSRPLARRAPPASLLSFCPAARLPHGSAVGRCSSWICPSRP